MDEITTDASKEKDRAASSTTTVPADPVDDVVTTEHTLRIGRTHLAYTATTGRIVLREEVYEDGAFTGLKAKAEVSITAYVAAASGDTPRPVTFAFNGGPGSSSVWLHLGLMGPRRVVAGDVGSLQAPPYGLTDNLQTLLSSTDLVFIDPGSIGLHEPEDRGYVGFLPTYAAVAHFHGRRGKTSLRSVLAEAEEYA